MISTVIPTVDPGTFDWIISRNFDLTLKCFETNKEVKKVYRLFCLLNHTPLPVVRLLGLIHGILT